MHFVYIVHCIPCVVYILYSRVTQIKTYSWDNAQVILVGNKCDMEDERVISFERGKQLADQLGVEFFETSAKENINVKVSQCLNYRCCPFSNIIRFFRPSSSD